MRYAICNWMGWGLVTGSCCVMSANVLGDQKGAEPSQVKQEDLVVGEPVIYKNLAIFPVVSKVSQEWDRFITLDEGLRAGSVTVTETGAARGRGRGNAANRPNATLRRPSQRNESPNSEPDEITDDPFSQTREATGQVNRLVVSNRSDRPLYLMPGEIIVGGKQDRTLAQELIVPAGARDILVNVFCVEHGRWAGRGRAESTQVVQGLTAGKVSEAEVERLTLRAQAGEFPQSGGSFGKNGRLAVQEGKNQQAVWDEVAQANRKSGASSRSGAYTANYAQARVVDGLKPFLQALEKPVAATQRVVGVVVAVDNKIEAADVFESSPLFRKLWPKLLKSFALDAASNQPGSNEKPCTVADATKFLNDAMQASVDETKTDKGLVAIRRQAKGIASFSVHEAQTGRSASAGLGGMGGGIHTSAFAK
jgi:hypothetical protein